jgi:hypothetical protein
MKVHLEHLFHFRCDRDESHYWSVADKRPWSGQTVYCPHCGHPNTIEGVESHLSPDDAKAMDIIRRAANALEDK